MSDAKLSGYKTATTAITWASGQDLVSLGDNEWTDLSDAIDNSTDLYLSVDLECVLASAAFTGGDAVIEVYLIPSIDGTNYPNWTGNATTEEQENGQYFVGSFMTSGATVAQRAALRDIALPNGKYKWGFRNRTNVALAASGNTISWRPHGYQAV